MATEQCAYARTPLRVTEEQLALKLKRFDLLPDLALVDGKVVCALSGRSPSSIQRDVKAGRLSPPTKIGPNAIRWRVRDVRDYLKGYSYAQ